MDNISGRLPLILALNSFKTCRHCLASWNKFFEHNAPNIEKKIISIALNLT